MGIGTWSFAVDRGGTFTDIVARDPHGRVRTLKLLSENPGRYADAALEGIRRLMSAASAAGAPPAPIASIRIGTTVATNALLERKGAAVLLITNKGFADALEIGYQARPDIFALNIRKPEMLYARVAEVGGRVLADGTVEEELDEAAVREALARARGDGIGAVAILFMHAYAYPAHERRAAALARAAGFAQVSASHEVSPLIKFVARGDTTVADAYLSPVLRAYVDRIERQLAGDERRPDAPNLYFMQSSGGLIAADRFHGRNAILSGPAGGVVGAVETAKAAGFTRIITFDMGGTSTDVAHYAGDYEQSWETDVAGVRLRAPMMRVETVAAGGGSVLVYDGAKMSAGPASAGAFPGPTCYRNGGPLTVTDANVMTGKIRPEHFPRLFGPQGNEPIDAEAVRAAFGALAARLGMAAEAVADGFLRIAVENMANAIRTISINRGHDVSGYVLAAFGGASGQHACLVAEALGMRRVLIHPLSSLLSAHGIALAPLRADKAQALERPLDDGGVRAARDLAERLGVDAERELADLAGEQAAGDWAAMQRSATFYLKYDGAQSAIPVEQGDEDAMRRAFENRHEAQFGFVSPEKRIIIESVAVKAEIPGAVLGEVAGPLSDDPLPGPRERVRFFSGGAWHEAALHLRGELGRGHRIDGPAIIIEPDQTVVVEPGWRAEVTALNHLLLTRLDGLEQGTSPRAAPETHAGGGEAPDPVLLEVFQNRFMAIAEQMGEALRQTAQSVNIRERLDFSCGVFDATGALIANAPHIPVHLGSMDRAVETVIRAAGAAMRPGDCFMLNAPYNGGTHLPDITVVTPVYDEAGRDILFFTASRGHHADIGGIAPGSLSPNARTIAEEGISIDPFKLIENGRFRESEARALLASGSYPARNPDANIADLKAQAAANRCGAAELHRLVREFGIATVRRYVGHALDYGEACVRAAIGRLGEGAFTAETDEGLRIPVRIRVDGERREAVIDFTGASPQHEGNFNAPEPVTRAAVLYVFRTLIDDDIPINAGCLRPLRILIPDGSVLSPRPPAAVAAGNVETSQVIVNALYGALGILAAAQGTMNNLTFGNGRYQYYETICSGAPAGEGFNGAAAVHTHMTNSRLTDPEVLELNYPVVLERFFIRRGSGGKGRWCAGDGVERAIRFREAMECAMISGYRRLRPFGLRGGLPGEAGENLLIRKGGDEERLPGCFQIKVGPGDCILIRTPTGGGYGPPGA